MVATKGSFLEEITRIFGGTVDPDRIRAHFHVCHTPTTSTGKLRRKKEGGNGNEIRQGIV